MAETVEELTINYTDETGTQTVKELDKQILSKGSWATVLYLFQELDKRSGEWSPARARLERYQKRNGVYRSQSRFKISSGAQALAIVEVLQKWFKE